MALITKYQKNWGDEESDNERKTGGEGVKGKTGGDPTILRRGFQTFSGSR